MSNIKGSAGKLWSDVSLQQDLEEKLNFTTAFQKSTKTLVRGSETYTLPDNATFSDTDEPTSNALQKSVFDEENDEDVESFGVNPSRTRKRKLAASPTRKKQFQNSKGPSSEKRFRRLRFDKQKESFKEKSLSKESLASSVGKNKVDNLKFHLAKNYNDENLFNVDFPPDCDIAELGRLMAEALGEKLPEVIQYAVKLIGKEEALILFTKCKNIEKSGGMLIANQRRRRTPGGVFLQLFKTSKTINNKLKTDLFEFSKELQKEIEKKRLEDRKRQEEEKIWAIKREFQDNEDNNLIDLPSSADIYSKDLK